MKNAILRAAFALGVACASAGAFDGSTDPLFSLKAVKVNDIAIITPTNQVGVEPGDIVVAEIYISDWAKAIPDGVRAYSAKINCRDGATSGDRGTVLPLGWHAPLDPTPCSPDPGGCGADEFCVNGQCVYPDHNPYQGNFIDTRRPDFIFFPTFLIIDKLISTLNYHYHYFATDNQAHDTGLEVYAGTLRLVASPDACGTFTFDFTQGADTVLWDANYVLHQPITEALIINVTECAGPLRFSLKAVKVNDEPIAPTSEVHVEQCDMIEAEIRISGWGGDLPGGARSYGARIAGRAGAVSGGNGTVLPLGWLAPLHPTPCWQDPNICEPEEVCDGTKCVFPGHNPRAGVLIDTGRADFIFSSMVVLKDILTSILDYTYFAQASGGTAIDTGNDVYGGTLKLVVSEYACETFTYGFVETLDTFLGDANYVKFQPITEALSIHVENCWPPIPPHADFNCLVDAGIPHDPDDAEEAYGLDRLELWLGVSAHDMTCADFLVQKVPPFAGDPAPECAGVEASEYMASIQLDRMISTEEWTCVLHHDTGRRACVGYLPGDVDGNLTTDPDDVPALALNLEGDFEPTMALMQCDVDRSNACAPPDILSAIDLLNGAEAFGVWEGASIPTDCPSGGPGEPEQCPVWGAADP